MHSSKFLTVEAIELKIYFCTTLQEIIVKVLHPDLMVAIQKDKLTI